MNYTYFNNNILIEYDDKLYNTDNQETLKILTEYILLVEEKHGGARPNHIVIGANEELAVKNKTGYSIFLKELYEYEDGEEPLNIIYNIMIQVKNLENEKIS